MFRRLLPILFFAGLLAACDTGQPAPTAPPAALATATTVASATPLPATATVAAATATIPPADTATLAPTAALPATAVPTAFPSQEPSATAVAAGPTATEAATAGAQATGSGTPEATALPATLQQLRTIETETANLRGLAAKQAVPAHFISPGQMAANVKQDELSSYTPVEARRDAVESWLLRLIDDRSIDLLQLQIDLLGEEVIGYYDPDTKNLYVRSDAQPLNPDAETTLAHEYTHALQDQNFGLEKIRPKNLHDNDKSAAVTGLIEGDAVLTQSLWDVRYLTPAQLGQLGSSASSTAALDRAPPYIRDSLLFPYEQGLQFVFALYKAGGYAAVNRAFASPPDTTEQIMHPERYLATPRDEPLPVVVPPLTSTLGAGWTLQDSNDLGEFDLGEILKVNALVTPTPVPAGQLGPGPTVDGWGGARYALYQNGSDALMLLVTRWDSTGAASAFATRLRISFTRATIASTPAATDRLWTDQGRIFGMRQGGDQVTYLSGTDKAIVQRVLSSLK